MKNQQILEIEKTYNKYFSQSKIKIDKGALCNNLYFLTCYLSNNEKENINGYYENDIFKIGFKIREFENGFILENLANRYMTKSKNQYLFCDYQKINFRITTGNFEKILKSFENFIIKLKNQLLIDYNNGNIHENGEYLIKAKNYN